MNKSISKIILSLMIFFFLTISFSCSNPSSDNSTANPTSQPTPNNPPAPTPDPEVYYTIIFNKNNESATGSTTSIKAKADSIVTLTANSFTLVGYNFTGWNTKADGTGTGYDDVSSLELTDDMTLYAQWGIASYSISIVEINHAPFIQSDTIVQFPTINVNKSQANYGESIEISISRNSIYLYCESVTVIGHDGSIIYTINDFDNNVYNYSYSFDMPDQEVTVNFAYNSSWYSVKIINSTPELGEVSLIGNGLNFPGYTVAFDYKPNEYYRLGTVSVYDSDNNPIDVVVYDKSCTDERYYFVMPDKNITIVVSFELISYIVKFNTDCSVQIPELKVERNPQIPQDQHANLYLADNSDCKGFLGWYTEPECIHQFDLNSKIDKNMTLYAKWETFIVNTKEQQKTRIPAIKYSCWIEGRFDEILLMSALDDLYINKPEIRISLKYASPIGVCEKSGVIKNVVSVVLPEDMTDLVKYAFANFTALKSVVLPEGLEYISKGAFMNCTALEQITIPKNVRFIKESIFEGCSSLKSIDLSENSSITAIETAMFKNCSSLENIKLPETNNNQYIFSEAFYGCKSLRSIILPETIKGIGVNAFSLCTALNSVEFKKLPHLCYAEDNNGKTKWSDITDDKSKNAEFITNTYSDCSLSFSYRE